MTRITAALCAELTRIENAAEDAYNAFDPDHGSDAALASIMADLVLTRACNPKLYRLVITIPPKSGESFSTSDREVARRRIVEGFLQGGSVYVEWEAGTGGVFFCALAHTRDHLRRTRRAAKRRAGT
jgi:hypothetical protein